LLGFTFDKDAFILHIPFFGLRLEPAIKPGLLYDQKEMPYALSRSLGLFICLFRRINKDRTSPVIEGPDIKGLSVNPKNGGKSKPTNKVKRVLASPRSIIVFA